ncbi:MAG: succinate--CoA ligase subunit alpha [Alphaproteobacteria bacterium]|nr:succinate--CoA ligase subunit alpha [Alphaproteobacteria bacterium]MBR3913094.1 succinate--CoA ligase subunit alpha [Alphaproteobacteria bacterium]
MKVQFPTGQTPILCQGITTASGAAHIERALAYGSNIVSGVSRDKGVSRFMNIPVFSTVKEAVRKTKPQISVIFSSPSRVLADTEEAIKAQIPMVICTTTHVPYHDILRMRILAQKKHVYLIGPASPGIVVPEQVLAGNMPADLFPKGAIGIVSRSSSLTYESVQQLSARKLGVSTCIGIGSGALLGTSFIPIVDSLLADAKTKAILIIGKVNSHFEMELASFLSKKKLRKPVFVYLAGRSQKHVSRAPILSCDKIPAQKDVIAHKKKTCAEAGMILISHFDKIGAEIKTYLDEQSFKLNSKKQMEKKEK